MLRRIEPLTGVLVLICAVWTAYSRWKGLHVQEAGALTGRLLWDGEYHRFITAAFLHNLSSWLHLVANAIGLLVVGTIVARECGRGLYVFALWLSVLGGWSAGLWAYPANAYQMGISGGILGLIGLLLAVEWAHAKTWGAFLRSRNTWILLITIAAGAALTWHMNKSAEASGVMVSQAGHTGGLVVGLVTGLAWLGRRGRRPVLGVIVGLLIGVLPAAYFAFPVYNIEFLAHRASRAEDADTKAWYLDRMRDLDPGHPRAGLLLALYHDDPAYLEGIREPETDEVKRALCRAYLTLAGSRLGTPKGRTLVGRAEKLSVGDPQAWFQFAEIALAAGHGDTAQHAFDQARTWYDKTGGKEEAALPAARSLKAYLLQLRQAQAAGTPTAHYVLCVKAMGAALTAARRLDDLEGAALVELELEVNQIGRAVAEIMTAYPDDHPHRHELDDEVSLLFWRLANNTADERLEPQYLYISAGWLARSMKGEITEELKNRFKGVLGAAREQGDKKIQARAEQWFSANDLPIPEPELDDDDDEG